MDIRWLQDFLALAELRNFTRAAEFRNLSQAAFSRRIQSVEHWVGTALVVKGSQPVRLTEAGEQFREGAQGAVERLLEARASIRGNQFEVMSQVRLAMPNVLARSEFRRILGLIGPGGRRRSRSLWAPRPRWWPAIWPGMPISCWRMTAPPCPATKAWPSRIAWCCAPTVSCPMRPAARGISAFPAPHATRFR